MRRRNNNNQRPWERAKPTPAKKKKVSNQDTLGPLAPIEEDKPTSKTKADLADQVKAETKRQTENVMQPIPPNRRQTEQTVLNNSSGSNSGADNTPRDRHNTVRVKQSKSLGNSMTDKRLSGVKSNESSGRDKTPQRQSSND